MGRGGSNPAGRRRSRAPAWGGLPYIPGLICAVLPIAFWVLTWPLIVVRMHIKVCKNINYIACSSCFAYRDAYAGGNYPHDTVHGIVHGIVHGLVHGIVHMHSIVLTSLHSIIALHGIA